MAGYSRSKNGVASLAYVPAIFVFKFALPSRPGANPKELPMPFAMSQAALPVFEINLNALSAILDKAEAFATAKKIDPTVLLHSRLSPDMFDLTRQIQVATDGARRGSARLAGVEPPSYEDNETTI